MGNHHWNLLFTSIPTAKPESGEDGRDGARHDEEWSPRIGLSTPAKLESQCGLVVRPRPWWLRFQLMVEEESRDGIGEQGRGREGGAVTWNVEKDLQSTGLELLSEIRIRSVIRSGSDPKIRISGEAESGSR
ncbi:hypothetical protein F2Q68_00006341 [Brassica cretica]|uniref:Uncharacterized protein n=1 Tax=Brassica cretica TaxID=69181 RepID=A0A8S9JL04_BRACR|nr:hypothetical protein F2Q68_00006341 [Brassica cretica]